MKRFGIPMLFASLVLLGCEHNGSGQRMNENQASKTEERAKKEQDSKSKSGNEVGKDQLKKLDDAVKNKKLETFFKEGPWEKLFPELKGDENVLSKLREGKLTVKKLKKGKGGTFIYAISAPQDDLKNDPSKARYALQVPKSILE